MSAYSQYACNAQYLLEQQAENAFEWYFSRITQCIAPRFALKLVCRVFHVFRKVCLRNFYQNKYQNILGCVWLLFECIKEFAYR